MHEIERTANLLGAAALTVADRLTGAAADGAGVGVSATAALITLADEPGIGVTELGRRIGLSQPACARMLDQLAERSLTRRRSEPGRTVSVWLTQAGTAAARRAVRARQAELRRLLGRLDATQRATLAAVLEPLLDGLFDDVGSQYVLCRLCDRAACVTGGQTCPVGLADRTRGGGPDG